VKLEPFLILLCLVALGLAYARERILVRRGRRTFEAPERPARSLPRETIE